MALNEKANDSDSSGFEIAGDTISVDSSATTYRMENGRRYHAYREGTYWCPNDERQNENLDISHHKFLLLLEGKLTLAPIKQDIKRVLDIGTGTGIWAIDFADEYPNTAVLGTDLSPIQPDMVPPNCRFEIDDARDEWTYPNNYFDFVHIRSLFGSVSDWDQLYKQAYRHTKPGGWIEHVEISIEITSDDGSVKPDSPVNTFSEVRTRSSQTLGSLQQSAQNLFNISANTLLELFTEAGEITGQSFRVYDLMTEGIQDAGFVNVVEKIFKTPLGGWPTDPRLRELGQWALLGFDVGLEGYCLATLTRVMGWSTAEVHVFLAQLRAVVRDKKIHKYHNIKVTYAQKPSIA